MAIPVAKINATRRASLAHAANLCKPANPDAIECHLLCDDADVREDLVESREDGDGALYAVCVLLTHARKWAASNVLAGRDPTLHLQQCVGRGAGET